VAWLNNQNSVMILEKKIPFTYWFSTIKWDILIVSIFSSVLYFLSEYLIILNIPVSVGAFLGTAIALLLSFKPEFDLIFVSSLNKFLFNS
jgi:putative membrane protein